jgi:hypothetical protein
MIINSKFSSLVFLEKEQWKAPFDGDVCHVQKFATDEEIRLQFVSDTRLLKAGYTDAQGHDTPVAVRVLYAAEGRYLSEILFSVSTPGEYEFHLTGEQFYDPEPFAAGDPAVLCGNVYITRFAVMPCCELCDTVLLSYTHRRNAYDAQFVDANGANKYFNFRIEGGIYPGNKVQALDNEVFRDQRFTPHQTAAEAYEVATLIIGTPKGVPQWAGNRVNNVFKLSDVYVDGVKTSRNEGSVPEITQLKPYYPLYVFKLKIEQPDDELLHARGARGVFVTFHGSGGETAEGKAVVGALVPSGTIWGDVSKPQFMKSNVPQSGFASVEGDGNTLIASDMIITGDLSAYSIY